MMPLHPWYGLRFRFDFNTKHGAEFQDFIAALLSRSVGDDFFNVKPYGKQGDKKCDGIIKSRRTLLQVYAPDQMKSSVTISKIDEDFSGAIKNWGGMFDTWVFVHN